MKIISTFTLLVSFIIGGCTYNQRHAGYGSVPNYNTDVISSPAPTMSQGNARAQQIMGDSDRALEERIKQQFNRFGDLASLAPNLQVSSQNGIVTLSGTVPTEQQKKMIDAMVANTSGVQSLNDQLVVTTPSAQGTALNQNLPFNQPAAPPNPPAGSLATRVQQALNSQPSLASLAPNIQVTEQNGTVTLSGTVPRDEDRQLIDSIVKNTPGVANFNDNLTVGLQPTGRRATVPADIFNLHVQGLTDDDRTLAQHILDGLRTDTILASLLPTVDINVKGGKVILQGNVQSDQQKRAIVSAVQRAAGADNVEDQLQVQQGR